MRSSLNTRIKNLESLPTVTRVDAAEEAARQQRASSAIADLIECLKREKQEYAVLDSAGRIRYWLAKIKKAEDYLALYTDHPPATFYGLPVTPSIEMEIYYRTDWEMTKNIYQDSLRNVYPFNLLEAQLDRLAELKYNGAKLAEWRGVHGRYKDLPWQWRPEYLELQADALKVIQAN